MENANSKEHVLGGLFHSSAFYPESCPESILCVGHPGGGVIRTLTVVQRKKVEARAAELIAEKMTLQELRLKIL